MDQLGLILFSAPAIWLVGRREHWSRWGYILGLCSQPFWVYAAWEAGQWAILALEAWYVYAWGQGIYFHWIRPDEKP